MKGKLVIIGLLAVILAFTVYKMMQIESSIRSEKKVTVLVEDESKPLVSRMAYDQIRALALNSDYYFIAEGNYFKRLNKDFSGAGKRAFWESFFIKGVNMGVALPGKYPGEFSLDFNGYLSWFRLIGGMNANVIRTYTILPPVFYEAFAYYNLHHYNKPLYLLQGVWTELPAKDNYYDQAFIRQFQKEIINTVDVIQGNAVLPEKPGHASGIYSTDVSKYVAGFLLGREWEPSSVHKTNQENDVTSYSGDFISMNRGNAMEAWLAMMLDFTVLYETQQYAFQHPVSFVNWLPLDPMYHSTEIIENIRVREYDNDIESVDFARFHSTDLFIPGIFAAYHVYPYYPDFIYLQKTYSDSASLGATGNSYYAYLLDLKKHTGSMPLLIAEYGLPSSRGNSHFSPFGYHQGSHSESEQAALSLALTRDIVNAKCAGAVYFEWIDEWFKHNWLVMDFETPEEDRKIWHNKENPEQHFGIMAMDESKKTIDGSLDDWKDNKLKGNEIRMGTDADASYFYLALEIPSFDTSQHNLYLAFDTYDRKKGDHKLPFSDETFSNGFEFLAMFKSPENAAILVDEPYSVFTDIYNGLIPVIASQSNNNGIFKRQLMLANRGRISLLGERTDSVIYDRSRLSFGKSSDPATSNADWFYNKQTGVFEIRLAWHLLNVSDPAGHFVLDDRPGTPAVEYTRTDAFRIFAFVTDRNDKVISRFPLRKPYASTWNGWDAPTYHPRLKPIYFALRNYFRGAIIWGNETQKPQAGESFSIASFYGNKAGAISISFDDAGYSQYQHALPVLQKYALTASFGVNPLLIGNAVSSGDLHDQIQVKRMGIKELQELAVKHEIALWLEENNTTGRDQILPVISRLNTTIYTLHFNGNRFPSTWPLQHVFARQNTADRDVLAAYRGVSYFVAGGNLPLTVLDSLFKARKNTWTIVSYHHLYDKISELPASIRHHAASADFIKKSDFEKHLRLIRNTAYWIAPERDVFRYLMEQRSSTIKTETAKNFIFLKLVNSLDATLYNHPLTVGYRTAADKIRISGSADDGVYDNRDGTIYFNVFPNKEVTIELLN